MGFLYYGNNSYAINIDDRPLAHLKIAILSMLRAGKSVAFSFDRATDLGSGRETLWISPSSDVRFLFHGSRAPRINEQWVRSIIASSNAATGMRLVTEPVESLVHEPAER